MCEDPLEYFQTYPVKRRRVCVGGRVYEILGPANYESLIDDPRVVARFDQDEYLPYWAEFWPASVMLAQTVAAWGPAQADKPLSVLELGCGLGLVSLIATELGYSVTASDYDRDALEFVKENARLNNVPAPRTRYIDWRDTYADLYVDRIVASEVLYEQRNLQPVAMFVRAHLKPDGFALICDAYRPTADTFEAIAQAAGLQVHVSPLTPLEDEQEGRPPRRARLFRLTHV